MGNSHLAADLLKIWRSNLPLVVHKNYGLPEVPDEILKNSLVIAISYSGNTEETLDDYDIAKKRKIPLAAISVNGELLEKARKDKIPFVQLPDTGIQPRSALGFMIKALLAIMKEKRVLGEMSKLVKTLKPESFERKGKELAKKLSGFIPIIYSSERNQAIAYNWKIKFNETSKIPAFYNLFPELNHNEMEGFDIKEKTKNLSEKFYFIFLKDEKDHPRIKKRMKILKKLFSQRKFPILEIELSGKNIFEKIFSSLILAD